MVSIEPRLSVAQLARTWGVSRQHVYNLIDKGDLRVLRIGSLIRIRPEDVEEYEGRQCQAQNHRDPLTHSPSGMADTMFNGGRKDGLTGFHAGQRIKASRSGS